ncbi:MAG: hypothetical protein WCI05_18775 [Myxococcales bacterium]
MMMIDLQNYLLGGLQQRRTGTNRRGEIGLSVLSLPKPQHAVELAFGKHAGELVIVRKISREKGAEV